MSPEAAHDLSIPELLCLLNQKLGLEYTKLREALLPPAVSAPSLESEIERLETCARDVLRCIPSLRNALQPANRLPPEIISCIAQAIPDYFDKDAWAIIPLTHLCRYWRESIISAPKNWTFVSTRDADMAAASMERAKGTPLHISFRMPFAMGRPRFPDIFIPYFQNTETLAVYSIPTFGEFTKMFPGFPRSMPNLRSLTLEADNIEGWDPSIDPFESLTRTLSVLSLTNVPLTPSLLELRTLASLSLNYDQFNLPLDTLLNFLEENRSLESVGLTIESTEPSLRGSRRQITMGNQFGYLLIYFKNVMDAQTLISSIPLRRGAQLELFSACGAGLNDIFSNISTTHLSNLLSPTFMEYKSYGKDIWLNEPNGTFSFWALHDLEQPFVGFIEFPLLPLTNIRQFHLVHRRPYKRMAILDPVVFHPSSFPALETLTIECDFNVSYVLSASLSNSSSSPSLNTIAFLNCDHGRIEAVRFQPQERNHLGLVASCFDCPFRWKISEY